MVWGLNRDMIELQVYLCPFSIAKKNMDSWKIHWSSLRLIEAHWGTLRIIENHWESLRLIETHWDSLRLIETHWDSWTFMETHRDSWRLIETHGDSSRLIETHRDFWRLMETHGDSWILMETHGESWRIMETIRNSKILFRTQGRIETHVIQFECCYLKASNMWILNIVKLLYLQIPFFVLLFQRLTATKKVKFEDFACHNSLQLLMHLTSFASGVKRRKFN